MPSSRPSPHYRFRNIEFWADKGRVWLVNHELAGDVSAHISHKVSTIGPGELLKRAIAIRASVGLSGDDMYPEKRFEANQLMERAVEVAKWAKFQGDPLDQKVLTYKSRHKTKRPVSMADGRLLLPNLNTKYTIRGADPGKLLLEGVQVRPDFSVPRGTDLRKLAARLRG